MGREFELKFAATEAALSAIETRFGKFAAITMETTYFDTPDRALSARHITLRCRMENGVSVCTLKTPTDGLGRGEWELERGSIEEAIPELCKLSKHPLLPILLAPGVTPICGARFLRKAKTVSLPNCTVEIALDKGCLLGGGKELPLCEVEVELKDGPEDAAVAFAKALAAEFGLQSEPKSKFKRAAELANSP